MSSLVTQQIFIEHFTKHQTLYLWLTIDRDKTTWTSVIMIQIINNYLPTVTILQCLSLTINLMPQPASTLEPVWKKWAQFWRANLSLTRRENEAQWGKVTCPKITQGNTIKPVTLKSSVSLLKACSCTTPWSKEDAQETFCGGAGFSS